MTAQTIATATAATVLTPASRATVEAATAEWKRCATLDYPEGSEQGAYGAARAHLAMVLGVLYGPVDGPRILEEMADNWESAEYCAKVILERDAWTQRDVTRAAYEDATWNALVDALRPSVAVERDGMQQAYDAASADHAQARAEWHGGRSYENWTVMDRLPLDPGAPTLLVLDEADEPTVHLAPCGDDFDTEREADAHAQHCGECAGAVEAHLRDVAGVTSADLDVAEGATFETLCGVFYGREESVIDHYATGCTDCEAIHAPECQNTACNA